MDFSNKEIYNYIDNHSSDESDILYELRRETELKCLNPIMLSGKIQGNFLAIISKLIKPFNVLEIGTGLYERTALTKHLPDSRV